MTVLLQYTVYLCCCWWWWWWWWQFDRTVQTDTRSAMCNATTNGSSLEKTYVLGETFL